MKPTKRLWQGLGIVFLLSFAALGWLGREIYLAAPPIPKAVITTDKVTLFTGANIELGQQAWLSAGGQQLGTVWGHGSYVAPDWSADWLHREAIALRDNIARDNYGRAFAVLPAVERAGVEAAVKEEMRRNTYDSATGTIVVSPARAKAVRAVAQHYVDLFGDAPGIDQLRQQYAMTVNTLPDPSQREALAAFFFWTSWAAGTDRPGETGLSYTSNWPHEPLVGNTLPT
ncbi:MAG TPA: nitric-oxide reductase large subunit, partial [Burkholderiales bacterium]|nr:nitric-oxide reductase large subunit [Burkholderiales bacterium]